MPELQKPIVLLMVRSGAENSIREQIKRHHVRSYYPRYLESTKTRGMVARPLFPGYLFVWASNAFWNVVDTIDGAFGCVRFGGEQSAAIVNPNVIKELRTWEGPTGYIRLNPKVRVGSRVTLRNGVTGVYAGMNERHRVRILFSLLGKVIEREFYPKDLVA